MTTLEEMVKTFQTFGYRDPKAGMQAVLEKHVGQMLARAHSEGQQLGARWQAMNAPEAAHYANRIITQLKASNGK